MFRHYSSSPFALKSLINDLTDDIKGMKESLVLTEKWHPTIIKDIEKSHSEVKSQEGTVIKLLKGRKVNENDKEYLTAVYNHDTYLEKELQASSDLIKELIVKISDYEKALKMLSPIIKLVGESEK